MSKSRVEKELSRTISELIQLDVKRSFPTLKTVNMESLIRVLQCYAWKHPETGYCQGMNFVCGLFLLLTQDEELTYACFQALISQFGLAGLFAQNVPMLLERFYQLGRALNQFYPVLVDWLDGVGIGPSYFASPWFITIFSAALHGVKEDRRPELLLAIWDAFLLHGWKGVFRAAVFIMGKLAPRLSETRFDQAVKALGEALKEDFMSDAGLAKEFKQRFYQIRLTGGMLQGFEHEYTEARRMADRKKPAAN